MFVGRHATNWEMRIANTNIRLIAKARLRDLIPTASQNIIGKGICVTELKGWKITHLLIAVGAEGHFEAVAVAE